MIRKQRKSSVQIRFEILEYLYFNAGPHLRTYLWRRATDLSYDDFLKYLEDMKAKKLVEELDGRCRLTQEGREIYVKLRDALHTIL